MPKEEVVEAAWAAGFIEGEGSLLENGGYLRIKVSQVNREPLERLLALYGGSIQVDGGPARAAGGWNRQPCWYWAVTGQKAESCAEAIEPHLSRKRREQLHKARARVTNART